LSLISNGLGTLFPHAFNLIFSQSLFLILGFIYCLFSLYTNFKLDIDTIKLDQELVFLSQSHWLILLVYQIAIIIKYKDPSWDQLDIYLRPIILDWKLWDCQLILPPLRKYTFVQFLHFVLGLLTTIEQNIIFTRYRLFGNCHIIFWWWTIFYRRLI